MENFTAYRVHNDDQRIQARLESVTLNDLAPGDVVIQAAYSDVNYKDALAVTGKGKIMRRFPLVAGIDVAGTVAESGDPRFQAGQEVLVVGWGLVPEGLSLYEAMAIGTAGFTAALAVERMEHNGQRPDMGPVAVTGASGGVGSVAVDLLAGRGYEVHAISGKADAADYLRRLGASEVIDRKSLELGTRPLEKACWGGAIDNLGGDLLAWLTRTVKPWGNIASIGLASSPALATTVIPFILRGVSLLGIYSVEVPPALRQRVWQRLAGDLRPRHLESIVSRVVSLAEVEGVFEPLMQGTMTGRTVVRIGG
ncbi:MAG: YhdH/YhfP family quinone oxidoreductase [Gammaproteobacteria bacterium]